MIFHADFDVEFNTQLIIDQYLHRKYEDFGHSYDDRLALAFPAKTIEAIKNATTEQDLRVIYQDFLVKNRITVLGPVIAFGVEKILNDHQDEIVGILENVYRKPVPFESVTVHVVYALGCPFSFKRKVWYCTGYVSSAEGHIKTSLHELNHCLFFLLCYEDLKKKYPVSERWFGLIKEGLAFLTDPDSHDNRPQVESLRDFILKNQDKSIEEIVDAVIKEGVGKEFA